ncbi:hypothetical protein AAFF_G00433410 [Aldrovandia affinis]|uniref:Uncharacterized protein n=1 Tax=Aldrovandia affinis TaxID=143900 RepID=A0AAD7WJ61_9TELE|nr:hypothetical protein AAFF_G00433410 [Aldrovandia affinis]
MESTTRHLKRQLEGLGVRDVKEFWLTKQPIQVICHLMKELGTSHLSLLFYSTEFLRVVCYEGRRDPPQWELIQKTCNFVRQLIASNWNLIFTESGLPLVVDIELDYTLTSRVGERGKEV